MKKILLLILSVIMTLSFSMFAFAACEDSHTHTWGEWKYNGDGTHTRTCSGDATHKETKNCVGDRNCATCGAKLPYKDAANESVGDYVPDVVVTDLYFVAGTVQMTLGTSKNTMPQGIVAGEEVVFTSSNPDVATVDATSGMVYAVKEGQSTITVTNAGRQASYLVNVTLGGMAPQIYFESLNSTDLTVALGEQLNLKPIIKFAGDYYDDIEVEYTNATPLVGTIDADGVFNSASIGTTEITVKVSWRDVVANELTCTLVVSVISDTHFVLNDGRANVVELYLTESHGGIDYITEQVVNVLAFEGKTEKDVELEIIDNEDGVVTFDSTTNTITAAKAGTAILRASFVAADASTVTKDFAILVKKPLAVYSEKIENFSTAFGVLPTDKIFGYETTIVEAYQNDRELQVEDGKVFDIRVSSLYSTNDIELVVYDDKCGYVLDVESYYAYITTPEEFIEVFKNTFTADLAVIPQTGAPLDMRRDYALKEGYIVLAKDIDMAGYTLDNAVVINGNGGSRTFYINNVIYTGTFDGQGHIVKNLTFTAENKYGLFGTMKGANVKNVAFDNVTFETGARELSVIGYEIQSAACYIENVYIKVSQLSNAETGEYNAALMWETTMTSLNLSNVIVEMPNITNDTEMIERGGALFGNGRTSIPASMKNVYVITNQKNISAYASTTGDADSYIWLAKGDDNHLPEIGTNAASETNIRQRRYVYNGESFKTISVEGVGSGSIGLITRYDSYINMYQAGNDYSAFPSYYWDKTNGIPVFKGIEFGEEYAYIYDDEITVNAEDVTTLRLFSNILTNNVVWTSSDESVATVDNGVLNIIKTGTTTITVSLNDGQIVDSCVVNVVLSGALEIVVDDLNYYTGDEYRWANIFVNNEWDFDPKLIYANTTYTENDELVTFTYEISDSELGTFDEYGVFTANEKVGSGIVTISVTIYGETKTYQFEIRVTSPVSISINGVEDTAYPEIDLFTVAEWSGETYVNTCDFVVAATLGGVEYQANIVSSNENIVKYENGKLIAQPIIGYQGEAIISVTVIENGVEICREVKVIVTKPSVESDAANGATFSIGDGMFYDEEAKEFYSAARLFTDFGEITGASQGDEVLEIEENKILGVELNDFTGEGKVTLSICNVYGGYTITCKAYNKVIITAEEFRAIFWTDNSDVTGAYILGNDIVELGGATGYFTTTSESKYAFTGLLDGNGYKIDGFINEVTAHGLFANLKNATIKNLAITNVTSTKNGYNTGIFGSNNLGENTKIENVYIEITSLPELNHAKFGALFFNLTKSSGKKVALNDVVIVMPTAIYDATKGYGGSILAPAMVNGINLQSGGNKNSRIEATNVVAITGTQFVAVHGKNKVAWVAENDANLVNDENGAYYSYKYTGVTNGIFRYDDLAGAVAAEKTQVGSWTITAEGIVKAS